MEIGFFFNYENQVVQLPVNPEKVKVTYATNNKTMEILKFGEINMLRDRKLSSIAFESFFPYADWFPPIRTKGQFESAEFYKAFFDRIITEKKPCRFIVTGIDINMLVSIEKFEYHHQAGDHEDAYYSLEVKEFRPYGIRSISLATKDSSGNVTDAKGVKSPGATRQETKIVIGSKVKLNGTVYRDSHGNGKGKTFANYTCKVSLINKKGTHIYHVTTLSGGPLGWVLAKAVKLA